MLLKRLREQQTKPRGICNTQNYYGSWGNTPGFQALIIPFQGNAGMPGMFPGKDRCQLCTTGLGCPSTCATFTLNPSTFLCSLLDLLLIFPGHQLLFLCFSNTEPQNPAFCWLGHKLGSSACTWKDLSSYKPCASQFQRELVRKGEKNYHTFL